MKTDTQTLEELKQQEKKLRAQVIQLARKRREIVIRLHKGGMTMDKIAEIEGITRQRVSYMISKGLN